MAVAGLHNVSAFSPSFFSESQSPGSARASSIFQMWRELEGDHVRHSRRSRSRINGSDAESVITSISVGRESDDSRVEDNRSEHEDNNSIISEQLSVISEQSSDLGDNERERVRQIFREWKNSGANAHSSNGRHINNRSGPQWLGENECERVRIIREWVQLNSQQRNDGQGSGGDGVAEPGSQIEQMRDGLVPGIGARRPIRKLCGRQALLDLLTRAQCERKGEIQCLSEQRPVSDFAHRNRIQALLRGRFLRNESSIPDKRPSSVAATELVLLRQRQTVSDLREGFLSKLDSSGSTSVKSAESDSSTTSGNNDESESTFVERENTEICTRSDLENSEDGSTSQQQSVVQVTEVEDPVGDNVGNTLETSSDNTGSVQEATSHAASARGRDEQILDSGNESSLQPEDVNSSAPHEADELNEPTSTERYVNNVTGDENQELDHHNDSARTEEFQESEIGIEDGSWQQLTRTWHESSADQWFQETSENVVVEQDQAQESHEEWPSNDLQEAIDNWLDIPSAEGSASLGSVRTFYFHDDDDDNAHSMELRELFSRRRVSSLLRSSFRESLNQVLQSHAERLAHHASGDSEVDNASFSPSLVEQDHQEQIHGDPTLNISDGAERNLYTPTSTVVTAFQPNWDDEFPGADLPHHNLNQQLGTEWDVINELRIDMARLQHRMNNMQSMLETCMEMQIELQRSVRQEVSAALNRTIITTDAGASKDNTVFDESQWDQVKKGICCLCGDSKIDSLLYRCGHMCTCSKCAEKLVQCMAKCPMCRAPVVEAVRAYFIQ